jgi:hypothetical protein
VRGTSRFQQPSCPVLGVGREPGGSLERPRCGCECAVVTRLGSQERNGGGDRLVGPFRCPGPVPRARLTVQYLGERGVRGEPVGAKR